MAKPWGRITSWAAEAERVEAEEKELAASAAASAASAPPAEAFPTLGESAASKPRKKKQQAVSLAEFTTGSAIGLGARSRTGAPEPRGLTPEEMMMLPTGPRDRSGEEEYHGGLGGAFRDYRGGADRFDRERDRGFGAGFEREREGGGGLRSREEPSRADGSSDWGAAKKAGRGYDDERRGSRDGDRELPSRADEVDNWGSAKKPLPPAPGNAYDRRPGRFEDRREMFEENRHSRADEVDNWARSKKPPPAAADHRPVPRYDPSSGADSDRWSRRELPPSEEPPRRRLVLAPRTRPLSRSPPPAPKPLDSETTYPAQPASSVGISDALPPPRPNPKPNPFGSARPREEILAEKGQDWRRLDLEHGVKERDSRPSSSHSSRAETMSEVSAEGAVKPRSKVNPFGDAKPREVLLEERGKDWRKMEFELEHRGVDRPETEEETRLREEIRVLEELSKQEVDKDGAKENGVINEEELDGQDGVKLSIKEQIQVKEKELEKLIRTLDDKVRFSQRGGGERPGSRSGRGDIGRNFESLDRPGSRSGRADSRAFDSYNRPGSRPQSRGGRVESGRLYESLDRAGSWIGRSSDSRKSFDSLERPSSRTGRSEFGRNYETLDRPGFHMEAGGTTEYAQETGGADIWRRSNEETVSDRR